MNNLHKLSWVVAAAAVGLFLAGGFQDSQTKIGVVDLGKILDNSDVSKKNTSDLQAMRSAREGLLQFLDTYKVASADQILRLKDLSIKASPTAAEKQELENIKAEVMKTDAKYKELLQKANPTPDEQTLLNDYGARARANDVTNQRLFNEFNKEWEDKVREQSQVVLEKARQSVQEVAKAGGYSAVFDLRVAPYGANDLTDAAMKAMNAKK